MTSTCQSVFRVVNVVDCILGEPVEVFMMMLYVFHVLYVLARSLATTGTFVGPVTATRTRASLFAARRRVCVSPPSYAASCRRSCSP